MGDREPDLAALATVAPAFDLDRDEFCRAFTVANDRLREFYRHVADRRTQAFIPDRRPALDLHAGRTSRDQHERIVGGSIAIDGDRVERLVGHFLQEFLQQAGGHGRVGRHEAKHRGHVRMDHAGALGDAGHGHGLAADLDPPRRALGHDVGGHDGFGGARPVRNAQVRLCGRQPGNDSIGGQRLHDHAGGERQHFLGRTSHGRSHRVADLQPAFQAIFARAGVCVARIDHHGARCLAGGKVLLAEDDRRCAKAVQREHARDGGAGRDAHEQHVLAVGLAHAGHGNAEFDAGHREQALRLGGLEVYGHAIAPFAVVTSLRPACRGTACTSCPSRRGRGRCDRSSRCSA